MRIGVDIGGTKIEAIALDSVGATLLRERVQTPGGNYPAILDAVRSLVHGFERKLSRKCSVGIGCPGAVSLRTGLIKNANSVVLNGKLLEGDLSAVLERPIRIENDANCFALSEAIDGAANQGRVVFGVILGTGVGGGIVVDKSPIPGRNRIAGEWGHNQLPWPIAEADAMVKCYCGKLGCIETFLSGPGLAREYNLLTDKQLTAKEISLAADGDDRVALECVAKYRDRLARSLALIVNILDPDVIVLGGGLSNIGRIYTDIRTGIEAYAFSDSISTEVVQARHGDSSGVRGAAWLWPADPPAYQHQR